MLCWKARGFLFQNTLEDSPADFRCLAEFKLLANGLKLTLFWQVSGTLRIIRVFSQDIPENGADHGFW
jgi:hypothetical protein